MTAQPRARSAYRVPRSARDSAYEKGKRAPALRVHSGTVTDTDPDDCSATVDVGDDEPLTNVAVVDDEMPEVGDEVEVHRQGDLTYIRNAVSKAARVYVQPDEPPADVPVGTLWYDTDAVRP